MAKNNTNTENKNIANIANTTNGAVNNRSNTQGSFFCLTGFVAVDATVRSFESSAVCRFPISVATTKTAADGTQTRKSALVTIEMWSKDAETPRFALAKKGNRVTVSGTILPDTWTDAEGKTHNRIIYAGKTIALAASAKSAPKVEVAEPAVAEAAPF